MTPESGLVAATASVPLRACSTAIATLAILAVTGACGTREPAAARPVRLRVAYTSAANVGDLPSLIAHRALERQGYQVNAIFFAQAELAIEALARGDADLANGGTRSFWAAVAKGADLVLVMEHAEPGYEIATRGDIRDCADLTGRTLALSSPGALPTVLGEAYLQRCQDATPVVLGIPHSGDRLAALAAGAVDAAVLQRSDVTRLEQREPGRFRVLARFDDEFPGLRFEGLFVNGRFARANRPAVVDYARARILANRQALDDPAPLFEEARRWPTVGTLDAAIVAGEVHAPAWARDGGLQPGSVAATLDFFVKAGSLPPSLQADRLTDPSFLVEARRSLSSPEQTGSTAPHQDP